MFEEAKRTSLTDPLPTLTVDVKEVVPPIGMEAGAAGRRLTEQEGVEVGMGVGGRGVEVGPAPQLIETFLVLTWPLT